MHFPLVVISQGSFHYSSSPTLIVPQALGFGRPVLDGFQGRGLGLIPGEGNLIET
jgi:hypothetical protein